MFFFYDKQGDKYVSYWPYLFSAQQDPSLQTDIQIYVTFIYVFQDIKIMIISKKFTTDYVETLLNNL